MKFKTKISFRITRLFFAISPIALFFLLSLFNVKLPRLINSSLMIFFLFGLLIFNYFNSIEGQLSGKERLKTDKEYRGQTIFCVVGLLILFVVIVIRSSN